MQAFRQLILLASILVCIDVSGQSDTLYYHSEYKPGYIINLEKDTVKGYLLDNIDSKLAFSTKFKAITLNSSGYTVTPSDILGFGFHNGRTFVRMDLKDSTKYSGAVSKVFVKKIIEGKIDAYIWRHRNVNEPDIFLINNFQGKSVHLTPSTKKILQDSLGNTYLSDTKLHIGLLKYVKLDSQGLYYNQNYFRYTYKNIKKDILEYNISHKEIYPVNTYSEEINIEHSITIGTHVLPALHDYFNIRIAYQRIKTNTEKSKKISFLKGIVFNYYRSINPDVDLTYYNSNLVYKLQLLNIIPLGIYCQGKSEKIKPYGYLGGGFVIGMDTAHKVNKYQYVGLVRDVIASPSFIAGLGMKIKAGNNFIILESSPILFGIYLQAGYSF